MNSIYDFDCFFSFHWFCFHFSSLSVKFLNEIFVNLSEIFFIYFPWDFHWSHLDELRLSENTNIKIKLSELWSLSHFVLCPSLCYYPLPLCFYSAKLGGGIGSWWVLFHQPLFVIQPVLKEQKLPVNMIISWPVALSRSNKINSVFCHNSSSGHWHGRLRWLLTLASESQWIPERCANSSKEIFENCEISNPIHGSSQDISELFFTRQSGIYKSAIHNTSRVCYKRWVHLQLHYLVWHKNIWFASRLDQYQRYRRLLSIRQNNI